MARSETDPLLAVADELYGLALPEFTPARDARAKTLKAEDADLAKRVKALKKPSTAAWVVNLLVRREAEQVEQVLAVGTALREAQAAMSGEELRTLTRQRRQLTAAVTTQARRVAAAAGVKVTQAVADQVEATLTAAMVDEGCAAAVRSGLLVTGLATTGVDAVEPGTAVAVPEALGFTATARPRPAPRGDRTCTWSPTPRPTPRRWPPPGTGSRRPRPSSAAPPRPSRRRPRTSRTSRRAPCRCRGRSTSCAGGGAELEAAYEEVDDELGDAEDVRAEAEESVTAATKARDAAAPGAGEAHRMSGPVSRVIFMCGPSGSGKSTYARRLESEGMIRLSFDVEMWRRGISTVPLPPDVRDEIEAGLRARLLELVAAGSDVVLDFSFWSRRMRDDYRKLLEPTGVVPETIYLATDRVTVLDRMRTRRGSHSDDYVLTEELAAQYFDHFEPPTADEGPLAGHSLRARPAACARRRRHLHR